MEEVNQEKKQYPKIILNLAFSFETPTQLPANASWSCKHMASVWRISFVLTLEVKGVESCPLTQEDKQWVSHTLPPANRLPDRFPKSKFISHRLTDWKGRRFSKQTPSLNNFVNHINHLPSSYKHPSHPESLVKFFISSRLPLSGTCQYHEVQGCDGEKEIC